MIDIDVVLLNLEDLTAFCSDGVTRAIARLYDAHAEVTKDPADAIAAMVEVSAGRFILCNLADGEATPLH